MRKISVYTIVTLFILLSAINNAIYAQCDPSQNVPIYPIDLCSQPDQFSLESLELIDECCASQQGNSSCFILRVPRCAGIGSYAFCFDPPCSIDGYVDFSCDANDMLAFAFGPYDLCMEQICIPTGITGDSIDILVCKPGAANSIIDLVVIGIDSVNLQVDTLVESCVGSLEVKGAKQVVCNGGASPPTITDLPITISSIADPSLTYLSCSTCVNPVFTYTGPPVTNCDGLKIDYTVSIPATECAPAQSRTDTFLVYPDIEGTLSSACSGGGVDFAFVPNLLCPGLVYQWSNSGGVIPGATDSTYSVSPPDGDTYCVRVFRDDILLGCDTFEVCGVASGMLSISCPPLVGGNFACFEDIPAPDTTVVTILDSCFNPRFEIQADTLGSGCIGDAAVVTRRYIVIDDDGDPGTVDERDTCVVVFEVEDNIPPMITCPSDTTVDCTSATDTMTLGMARATDNCTDSVTNITFSDNVIAGTCPDEFTIERTWTAVDSCGNNSTCLQTIMVQDTTPPVITCPVDITIECDVTPNPNNTGNASATDNCTNQVLRFFVDTIVPGSCADNYIIERTWTAQDDCGNISTCRQNITVDDTTPPVIVCPGDTTVDCTSALDSMTLGRATATDICTDVVTDIDFSDIINLGNCDDNFTILRTWTATDSCGNASTCLQTIMVQDTTPPVITCPVDITIECDVTPNPNNTGNASATDNCTNQVLRFFVDTIVPGSCADNYIIERTWTAQDDCGNISTCRQNITVDDSTPPNITCPSDTTVDCTSATDTMTLGMATATDNCTDSVTNITFSDNVIAGTCPDEFTIERTWTATDSCGNSSTCLQTIMVQDTTAPDLSGCITPNDTVSCENADFTTWVVQNVLAYFENCATDNCSGVTVQTTGINTIVGCGAERVYQVEFFVGDSCLNTVIDTAYYVVIDTTPPVILCPIDTTVDCTSATDTMTLGRATATDLCSAAVTDINFVDAVVAGSCPAENVITRTWTAIDSCGNAVSCIQTITVQDTMRPMIVCPSDTTVDCTSALDSMTLGRATATDNCDAAVTDIDFVDAVVAGSCPAESVITRTWTATDSCGNAVSCIQTITVQDTMRPMIVCPSDTTVDCTSALDSMTLGRATATDNCDAAVTDIDFVDAVVAGSCPAESVITRTWTATDSCGNAVSCIQTITVQDTMRPMIVCPSDTTVDCTSALDSMTLGRATATDNCDAAVTDIDFVDAVVAGSCPAESVITRTWTAIDSCGNAVSCIQTITVQDTMRPMIVCPSDTTVNCEDGITPAELGMATATDNCDAAVTDITFNDVTSGGGCASGMAIQRIWTATDSCGNARSCTQLITIQDTTRPMIVCPLDTTVDCTSGITPAQLGMATATDNCDANPAVTFVDAVAPGTCPSERVITRTWTATDVCSNTRTCIQTITVQDTTMPMIVCPSDTTVDCTSALDSMTLGRATATDNCDAVVTDIDFVDAVVAGSCPAESVITRTWTATDSCGNAVSCIQTITVQDTMRPMIVCPSDTTVDCTSALDSMTLGRATATDNCDAAVTDIDFVDAVVAGSCPAESVITRTWTAIDSCGNAVSCIQTITVQDTMRPMIVCPSDTTVNCEDGITPAQLGMATATDNCDAAVTDITFNDVTSGGGCASGMAIQRIWTATDSCGNARSCTQLITIQDTTRPMIVCPLDTTVDCTSGITPAQLGMATATDNCDANPAVTFVDAVAPGACPSERVITRTWTATDVCSNTRTCIQTITVQDTMRPMIVCPSDTTVDCTSALDSMTLGRATATDNCDAVVTDIDFVDAVVAGSCPAESVITRTWTATDSCGNAVSCIQTITVQDTMRPMIVCPSDTTVDCTSALDSMTLGRATATDNCDAVVTDIDFVDAVVAGSCPAESVITRTWTAIDSCGNAVSCIQTITVQDTMRPMIVCPSDTTVNCEDGITPAELGMATATDNCDAAVTDITFTDVTSGGGCASGMAIQRIWTATDSCGNARSCTQLITIQDTTRPMIVCPLDTTVDCTSGITPAQLGMATATDNCDANPAVTFVDAVAAGACPSERVITRTWTATDVCSNTRTCIQTITVQDTMRPMIVCPSDTTVDCTSALDSMTLGRATATDNCDAVVTDIDFVDAVVAGSCPAESVITRTWTATDSCGNAVSCIQTITVQDTMRPMIVCPSDTTVDCTSALDSMTLGRATATDNCDAVVTDIDFVDAVVAGSCPAESVITRTWTAIDSCGNAVSCIQTITVQDTMRPMIVCPSDTTVNCEDGITPAELGMATATDNCDAAVTDITFTDVTSGGGCASGMAIQRIWTATDSCGNARSCTQLITIQDTTRPMIVCPLDTTVDCTSGITPAQLGMATATDNCDANPAVTFVDAVAAGACPSERVITRTWTATDVCSNTRTCIQTITVQDTMRPMIVCPSDTTVDCTSALDSMTLGRATATDNCDAVVTGIDFVDAVVAGSCPAESVITRTWTAIDSCGNAVSCIQTITVQDTMRPMIVCPSDTTVDCTSALDSMTLGRATATDNCDAVVTDIDFVDAVVAGSCPAESVITRTWTAIDSCGNAVSCIQTITVQDTMRPMIVCPSDTTVNCEDGITPAELGMATATDNCDAAVTDITFTDVTSGGGCASGMAIQRIWTATDSCGNARSCTQLITVQDTTRPMIVCPLDTTVDCTSGITPAQLGMATATDNCDANPAVTFVDAVAPGTCPSERVITRTWTATDVCSNTRTCIQTITVQDTMRPMIVCPSDTTVDCTSALDSMTLGRATATDNCDAVVTDIDFVDAVVEGSCPAESVITRTWTAIDSCGNAVSCIQTITVQDTMRPMIVCPSDTTVDCTSALDSMTLGRATATDNCDAVVTDIDFVDAVVAGSCPAESVITRTWTAIDSCGNAVSCIQTITVQDTMRPMIVCPSDTTVNCEDGITPAELGMATATDNCDAAVTDITFTDVTSGGGCASGMAIQRIWTATDSCGNARSCTQLITIQDTTRPMIVCPLDTTVDCTSGITPAQLGMATATDNCDANPAVTFVDAVAPGTCPSERVITRTWTATDVCSNTRTCIQTITVQDTMRPMIVCPSDTTVDCTSALDSMTLGRATATDNCDAVVTDIDFVDAVVAGSCPAESVITRTWTATDSCGNAVSCIQTITVQDTMRPMIVCPSDTTVDCTSALDSMTLGRATATDNCDAAVIDIDFVDAVVAGSCPAESVITRTWTATDSCGNAVSCIQTITVQDTMRPMIVCPSDTTVNCEDGITPAELGMATATDNCDAAVTDITFTDVTSGGGCASGMAIQRIWTATDSCGNARSCTQLITVQDTTRPMIVCPLDTTVDCTSGITPAQLGMATATDNCDANPAVTFVDAVAPGACPSERVITRTWTATDVCSNTRTCIQVITVQDTTMPMIVCPSDTTVDCNVSSAPTNTGAAIATDNCDSNPMITFNDNILAGSCAQESTIERTWTATDACGNAMSCQQIITIQDTTPPSFEVPVGVVIPCDADLNDLNITGLIFDVIDNCGISDTNYTDDLSGITSCLSSGIIERTWTVEDECGNISTQIQEIRLSDLTCLPCRDTIIVCPGDTCLDSETYELGEVQRVEICEQGTDAILTTNGDSCITLTSIADPINNFDTSCLILCDEFNGLERCDTTIIITILPPTKDTAVAKLPFTDSAPAERDTICLSKYLDYGIDFDSVALCDDGMRFTQELFNDTCVIVEAEINQTSVDYSCAIHCYEFGNKTICDTTIILVVIEPVSDTIFLFADAGENIDVCLDSLLQLGSTYDSTGIVNTSNSLNEQFISPPNDTCLILSIDDNFGGVDTFSTIHCYDFSGCKVCDTTTVIAVISPPRDTIFVIPGDTCLTPRELQIQDVDRAEICDAGNDVNLTLGMDSCFNVELKNPNFQGMDTLCIIHCDSIGDFVICDTTTVFVITCLELNCVSEVNLSLDENCEVEFKPGIVLKPQIFPDGFYTVVVRDEDGNPHSSTFTKDDIGKKFSVSVFFDYCGNSCWSEVLIEDKLPPIIECVNDTMNCIEYQFGYSEPIVTEHCQGYTLHRVDEIITNLDCDPGYQKLVTQKWVAIDDSGNVSDTCEQGIWIERFPMGEIEVPVQDTILYCGSGFEELANGFPTPMEVGVPMYDTLSLYPLPDFFCNMLTEYEDVPLGKVGCTEKIMRIWTVTEWWCREDSTRRFNQMITLVDTVGPMLNVVEDTIEAKAGQRSCDALVDLPMAQVDDFCNDIDRVDIVYPGGFLADQNGGQVRLEVGANTIVYRAYDECYNESTDTLIVIVDDGVGPIAVCEQNTVVTLDNDGVVHIYAETFDDGSFDECALESMEVRRMVDNCASGTDDWGAYVEFCCADIGTEVMVAFRVTDKSGNMNTCMVRATVQDKQAPTVVGLPDITVDCRFDWDPNNLDVFGKFVFDPGLRDSIIIDAEKVEIMGEPLDGVVYDNCPPVVEERLDTSGLTNCGLGFIMREFTFTDNEGNISTSVQRIDIENDRPFTEAQIDWPRNIDTVNVCGANNLRPQNLTEDKAFPRFNDEDECSLVGYDYKDELIDASLGNEACYKIIRTWTVIDWCQEENGVHPKWSHDQVIEVQNTLAPMITSDCADTVRCVYNNNCEPEMITLIATAEDSCTASEDLFWQYKVDTSNDGTFDIFGQSNDASGIYPIGVHRIKFIVEDLCGNRDSCSYIFEIRNCKAPTAYCKNGLVAELTPMDLDNDGTPDTEMAEVWASDLDEGSHHICGHPVVLSFSADTSDKVRMYDCDSLTPPIRPVTIWVTDKITGNTSKCLTFVNVQDNNNVQVCANTLSGGISGLISTEWDLAIDETEVALDGSTMSNDMTDRSGTYTFKNVPLGGIYEISPQKDGDDMNGVSTGDLIRIQRHLLGMTSLSSPYQFIAADVNNSESVSAADIAELRKLILGVYDELPNNSSWRFVDGEYNFPDPQDPWLEEFPEEYELHPFEQDMEVDFVGVKIGDINGDVSFGAQGTQTRSSRKVIVEDGTVKAGRMYEVMFNMEELSDLEGYQFTMEWNPEMLEMSELIPNLKLGMNLGNFNMSLIEEGIVTTSWNSIEEIDQGEERLFAVRFTALEDGRLSEMLNISGRLTTAEAYVRDMDVSTPEAIELTFTGGAQSNYFALYQNEPNPWNETTVVGFHIPTADQVRMTIFDETGRLVKMVEEHYNAGYNEIQLNASNLYGKGVLYYRLETKGHTATRKMILID